MGAKVQNRLKCIRRGQSKPIYPLQSSVRRQPVRVEYGSVFDLVPLNVLVLSIRDRNMAADHHRPLGAPQTYMSRDKILPRNTVAVRKDAVLSRGSKEGPIQNSILAESIVFMPHMLYRKRIAPVGRNQFGR